MENKSKWASRIGVAIVGAVVTTAIDILKDKNNRKNREDEIRNIAAEVVKEMQKNTEE